MGLQETSDGRTPADFETSVAMAAQISASVASSGTMDSSRPRFFLPEPLAPATNTVSPTVARMTGGGSGVKVGEGEEVVMVGAGVLGEVVDGAGVAISGDWAGVGAGVGAEVVVEVGPGVSASGTWSGSPPRSTPYTP